MQEKYAPEEIEVAAQAHWNKTHAARANLSRRHTNAHNRCPRHCHRFRQP